MGTEHRAESAGLRAVAILEALKGVVVLALGLGLLSLLHRDVEVTAEHLCSHLHLNLHGKIAGAIFRVASGVTDPRIWEMAFAAAAYSAVRFTEAYGLWHRRVWAEWFAILSGALYLPWEIVRLAQHPTPFHWAVLLINLTIISYIAYIRARASRLSPA